MIFETYDELLKEFWHVIPPKQQLYSHLPSISKTIQVRWTRYVRYCWKSMDKLISDILLWTQLHGCASVGQLARTYQHQLCVNMRCNFEDLPGAMANRDRWREWERERERQTDRQTDREKESGKSMLPVWLDDDDDDDDDDEDLICSWDVPGFCYNWLSDRTISAYIFMAWSFVWFVWFLCLMMNT